MSVRNDSNSAIVAAMYLKSLTIKGFKSFADPVNLVFEPGVTVVVGPNGSGKSNVVDALMWALGVQGAKTVRSSKMEDVIFAGSPARAALGRAEVSLTVSDDSGRLPANLSEIKIARTLFRSGESEYSINNASCRLLDVEDVLSGLGIGRRQHMVISQGNLEWLLNARPEERRSVIEEAAGILKHRRRRERSMRRLVATSENLSRLSDLLKEVKRQLRPLERQASAARAHAAYRQELLNLNRYLIGHEIGHLEETQAARRIEMESKRAAAKELGEYIAVADRRIEEAASRISRGDLESVSAVRGQAERLAERANGLIDITREREEYTRSRLSALADIDTVRLLEAEASGIIDQLHELDQEESALSPGFARLSEAEQELERVSTSYQAMFGNLEVLAERARQRVLLEEAVPRLEGDLRKELEEIDRLDALVDSLEGKLSSLNADVADLELQGSVLQSRRQEIEEGIRVASMHYGKLQDEFKHSAEAHRSVEREHARVEARLETLEKALSRSSLRNPAWAQSVSGYVGRFWELVRIDAGMERAVEAALPLTVLTEVLVAGTGGLTDVVNRALADDAGIAILPVFPPVPLTPSLPATSLLPGSPSVTLPAYEDIAGLMPLRPHIHSEHVLVSQLLDRLLGNVYVAVEGRGVAATMHMKHPSLVVVTPEGDRYAHDGWHVRPSAGRAHGGSVSPADVEVERKGLQDIRSDLRAASDTLEAARLRLETESDHLARLREDLHAVEEEQHGNESMLKQLRYEISTESARLGEIRADRAARGSRVSTARSDLDELMAKLASLGADEDDAAERAERAETAFGDLEAKRMSVETLRRGLEIEAAGIAERRSILTSRLEDVEERIAESRDQVEASNKTRSELEVALVGVQALRRIAAECSERLEELSAVLRTRQEALSTVARESKEELDALMKDRIAKEADLGSLRDALADLSVCSSQDETRIDSLKEVLQREVGCSVEEAMAAVPPEVEEGKSLSMRAREIESAIASLGPINALALDELAVLEERYAELQAQVDDVSHARGEVMKAVEELDEEMLRMFMAAFEDVNENFQQVLTTMFPGGSGRLFLTDPQNILECGLEIEARPSGKGVKRLSLLSGGERSLVALSFLFALFRSRPSPFYVMDEVEAALDDINLNRFLDTVGSFRNEAQLIIVSHQKRTMEMADVLYGVSMSRDGTSKVLSKKLED